MKPHLRNIVRKCFNHVIGYISNHSYESIHSRTCVALLKELRKEYGDEPIVKMGILAIDIPDKILPIINCAKIIITSERGEEPPMAFNQLLISLTSVVVSAANGSLDGDAYADIISYTVPKRTPLVAGTVTLVA